MLHRTIRMAQNYRVPPTAAIYAQQEKWLILFFPLSVVSEIPLRNLASSRTPYSDRSQSSKKRTK